MKKLLCIFVIISIIILIYPTASLANSSISSESYGNSNGNIENRGLLAQKDEWIYYVESNDGNNIYRMNKEATIVEKIITDNCSYINIKDDSIYFLTKEYIKGKPHNTIHRAKLDGTDMSTIIETGKDIYSIDAFIVYGDWLYYSGRDLDYDGEEVKHNSNLSRININTKEKECVVSKWVKSFQIEGEWIYLTFSELGYLGIYKVKLDGTEFQEISQYRGVGCFVVHNNIIYFSIYGELRKMNIDGSNDTLLDEGYFMYMNILGDWLYYIIPDHLARIRLDGNDNELLIEERFLSYISTSNDMIYFSRNDILYQIDMYGKNKKRIEENPINSFLMDDNGSIIYRMIETNEVYKIKDGMITLVQAEILIPFYLWDSAYKNDSIYYSAEGGIYKYDTLTKKKTQLTDAMCNNLLLTDKYIVYDGLHGIRNIYKINKNGDDNKLLVDKADTEFVVYENWLYYGREKVLYKMNIDTGKIIKLQEGDFNVIYAGQNGVYVIDNYTTYLVENPNNSMIEVADSNIHIFQTNENNVLFTYDYCGNGLFLMNKLKEEEELISNDRITGARIHNGIVYYTTSEFCRLDTDRSNFTVIDATIPVKLTVFSDVPAGYVHEEAIKWAYDNKISNGYGDKFGPDDSLTEGQFVTMLTRYCNLPYDESFAENHYADKFYKAIDEYNLPLKGNVDSAEKDKAIKRGKIAQVIAGVYGLEYSVEDAILFMYKNDFSNGMSAHQKTIETYGKDYDLTRAAAVAFMQKMSHVTHIVDIKGNTISVKERNIIGLKGQ